MHDDERDERFAELFHDLGKPGKECPSPRAHFPLYGPDVTLCGGEPRFYPCLFENEFIPQIETLEAMVDDDTVAILYNFPSNPTGATLDAQQRDELLAFARRHDLWIVSDEVYDRIVYDCDHVSFLGTGYENLILINSFSKTFAMTGWRIGYLLSTNLAVMQELIKVQYYITACSNDAMQYAVLEAFVGADDYPEQMAVEFKARRDLICSRLNAMPGVSCHVPRGAFYVFPKVEVPGLNSEEVALELLKGGVLCSPGTAFGGSGEGHLRFAYTVSRDDISAGMDKIAATLSGLRK